MRFIPVLILSVLATTGSLVADEWTPPSVNGQAQAAATAAAHSDHASTRDVGAIGRSDSSTAHHERGRDHDRGDRHHDRGDRRRGDHDDRWHRRDGRDRDDHDRDGGILPLPIPVPVPFPFHIGR